MNFKIIHTKSCYPDIVKSSFAFNKIDAFHEEETLNVIHNSKWECITIIEDENVFFNSFRRNKIGITDFYDIEPFLGYSGPMSNSKDETFIKNALIRYSEFCSQQNIIAEIIRFNPLLENHKLFLNTKINIFQAKDIVITSCYSEKDKQLNEFSKSRKRDIKTAQKSLSFSSHGNISDFKKMYNFAINEKKAKKEWHFDEKFFENISQSEKFKIVEVKSEKEILSMCILIKHKFAAYYFLAANRSPQFVGANDLLLFNVCLMCAKENIPFLTLGGGNSASEDDPLLIYKKKFSPHTYPFHMGKIVHNQMVFDKLCDESVMKNPDLKNLNYFLKYRLDD
jgi:hypothetical protein